MDVAKIKIGDGDGTEHQFEERAVLALKKHSGRASQLRHRKGCNGQEVDKRQEREN